MTDKKKCPFCGSQPLGFLREEYLCGTCAVPGKVDQYSTGIRCDLAVYRKGFRECMDLLRRVIDMDVVTDEVKAAINERLKR